MTHPVQVGAVAEQILGRNQLAPVARSPESVGHDIWRWITGQVFLNPVHHSERCRLPNRGTGSALNEPACRAPCCKSYGVRQGCTFADYRSWCFYVCAVVQQRIKSVQIIATGGPVKGTLRMAPLKPGAHVGTVSHQRRYSFTDVRKVPRPVRSYV